MTLVFTVVPAVGGVTIHAGAPGDAIPTLDNSYGVLELAYNLGKASPVGDITQDGIAFEGGSCG